MDLTFDRFRKAPDNILWVLTTACPVHCVYCYCDKYTHYTPLSLQRIFEIIEEAYLLGVSHVDVVGGEIFNLPDWDKIVKKLVDMNMSPSYISTKTPISPLILSKLLQTGYNGVIQISLDALSSDLLTTIIKAWPNYLEEFLNGIRLLDEHDFKIQVNTILTSVNCKPDQIDLLYSVIRTIKNLEYWEIRVASESLYPQEKWESLRPNRKEITEISAYVRKHILTSSNVKILISDNALSLPKRCLEMGHRNIEGGICGMLQDRMVILPDGKVTACEELYWHPHYIIGNLENQSITEVWQSDKAYSLLAPKKELFEGHCSVCGKFSECTNLKNRCPVKIIRAYGNGNYSFPDPRCQYAPEFNLDKYI